MDGTFLLQNLQSKIAVLREWKFSHLFTFSLPTSHFVNALLAARPDEWSWFVLAMASSPFLKKVPGELRNKIYRLLLVNDKPITKDHWPFELEARKDGRVYRKRIAPPEKLKIHPAILATCRQILLEAKPILYHENTLELLAIQRFQLTRSRKPGQDLNDVFVCHWIPYMKLKIPWLKDIFRIGPRGLQRFRRLIFKLELYSPSYKNPDEYCVTKNLLVLRNAVRDLSNVLAGQPEIQYLKLQVDWVLPSSGNHGLRQPWHESPERLEWLKEQRMVLCAVVATYFGELRRITTVELQFPPDVTHGWLDAVREEVAQKMASSSTSNGNVLLRMYEVLESKTSLFAGCDSLRENGLRAVVKGDVAAFKDIRKRMMDEIHEFAKDVAENVFLPEEKQQVTWSGSS